MSKPVAAPERPIVTHEASDWGVDPDSGAAVVRLTTGPMWSHNIYCEQPYGSPDGRRILIGRTGDLASDRRRLFVADLNALSLTCVEEDAPNELVAHTAWGGWVYYVMRDGSLRRLSLATHEREELYPAGAFVPPPAGFIETASPDDARLVGYEYVQAGHLRSYVFNLASGERTYFLDGPDNRNPHAQFDLAGSGRVLQQLFPVDQPEHVKVITRHVDTGEVQTLPIGGEDTAESTGHMAWIGKTGQVACAVGWRRDERLHDPRHPQGNLIVATPGEKTFRVIDAPEHGFYHVSVSRCGRYFVCDDFFDFRADAFRRGAPGPIRIVVGSFESGRTRVLLSDCQAYGIAGSSRYEPTPYFTADNRWVIYNASPFGLTEVFAARLPDNLLAGLD